MLEYCSIVQNKHLAYTESTESSRSNSISKKHVDQSWLWSVYNILSFR